MPAGGSNRAGDIVLMSKSGPAPIAKRYYFAAEPHYTWHGSADETDSRIPLVLAQVGGSGRRMRKIVQTNVGNPPSEKDLPAIVRAIIQNHLDND